MSSASAKSAVGVLDRYRTLFEERFASGDGISAYRRSALEHALSLGWPTQRDESWKYTNLRRLESRQFAFAAPTSFVLDRERTPWMESVGHRIVLVNGHSSPAFAAPSALPPGATVVTLAEWIRHDPEQALAYLREHASDTDTFFERLGDAFFEDGVLIDLHENTWLDSPIHVVHAWTAQAQLTMSHPRILLRAGKNSRCTLIEQFVSLGDGETFTNTATRIRLAADAQVEHYLLQEQNTRSFHIAHACATLERGSTYTNYNVPTGAALGRTTLKTTLRAEHSHVALHGLLLPTGSQHSDTYTRIDHAAPHTTSEEDYRGIADGRGRGVFNGKILVRPHAQKTDARQSSRNLLLAPTAEIDAKPELEIYANDVKCSHGATIGQLDPTALFYLRSRGLSEADARVALIRAFAHSVLSRIKNEPVRRHLEQQLERRFGALGEGNS